MLHDDQLFWDFSKSTILVDDLDLVSRSQHSGRVKQPVVVSQPGFVRSRSNQLCECYIQADQYVEPLGTEKARERGRGGLDVMFTCHLDCCIKTLSQYTTFVTGIHAYAVNMRILAWKLCMFFRHHELSFIPIIISNKKGASFGWLGRYPTPVSVKLYTLCMQFPISIWMKNKTTVISSRLIRERVKLVNIQSVYLV